jgi:hypothetical protein
MRQGRVEVARGLLLGVALLGALNALHAQGVDQDGRIRLDVVVADAAGKPVPGLQHEDFKIFDDGKERPIAVNNGFVEMGYIRQGLEKFLRENEGQLRQPTTLTRLVPSGIQYLSQATRDGNALAEIVEGVGASVRPRGLDPMPVSLNALTAITKKELSEPGRKLLVGLGPGWPTPGAPQGAFTDVDERNQRAYAGAAMQIAKLMHDARIVLYGGYSAGDFYMRDDFEAEANSFYELSFTSSKAKSADEFHPLRVQVKRPGLTARTITGYYDEPEFSRPEQAIQPASQVSPQLLAEDPAIPGLVSVAQLTQLVEQAKGKRDGDAAREIEHLKLTERLNSTKLVLLSSELPGAKSRNALRAVGDASVFLELPKAEIPDRAAPDIAEQKRVVSLAVDYLGKTVPKLPNFLARRTTVSFEAIADETRASVPLHQRGEAVATIQYRDGNEVVREDSGKSSATDQQMGLITKGIFGPVLSTVIVDASHGEMKWSHWEAGPRGPMEVFSYRISARQSHYEVSYPAILNTGADMSDRKTAYHGEVGVDAATGTILRLMLQADLEPGSPMQRADIMVEYGAVEIGGKSYTCPVRSVSISRGKSLTGSADPRLESMREVTRLNDVVFDQYHVFRSEMRIVPQ